MFVVPFIEQLNKLEFIPLAVLVISKLIASTFAVVFQVPLKSIILVVALPVTKYPETPNAAELVVGVNTAVPLLLTNRNVEDPLVNWNEAVPIPTEAVTEPVAILLKSPTMAVDGT